MKARENEHFITKVINNYKSLSKKQKTAIIVILCVFVIGSAYNFGEAIGKFLYSITY